MDRPPLRTREYVEGFRDLFRRPGDPELRLPPRRPTLLAPPARPDRRLQGQVVGAYSAGLGGLFRIHAATSA
ncbi:MAG: hypothetical protein L0216_12740 [Planctomycetales bacterium]|nr:hypothetical protein [Planctomycetales bacterium]